MGFFEFLIFRSPRSPGFKALDIFEPAVFCIHRRVAAHNVRRDRADFQVLRRNGPQHIFIINNSNFHIL